MSEFQGYHDHGNYGAMKKSVDLNIPIDASVRARKRVIREILDSLISHSLTLEQTADAIEHLITADAQRNKER